MEYESKNGDEPELAEQEFISYCDANEIDRTEEDMDDESRADFLKIKKRFMKAVDEKRLYVEGTSLVYTVSRFSSSKGESLTVSRPVGRDFIAMDGLKDTQQMSKFNAFLASLTGKEKSYIAKLDIKDRQFLQDIGTLFLTA
jgi:hypothetical protein